MEKKRVKQLASALSPNSEPGKAVMLAAGALYINNVIRSEQWLAGLPGWANPINHVPNAGDTVGLTIVGAIIAGGHLGRAQKELQANATRCAAGIMLAGIAANALVELPETQPLARIVFRHSVPDPADFMYGAATSVALFPRTRRWIEIVAKDSLPKTEPDAMYTPLNSVDAPPRVDKFGPSSLEVASRLYDFSSEAAPAQYLADETQN